MTRCVGCFWHSKPIAGKFKKLSFCQEHLDKIDDLFKNDKAALTKYYVKCLEKAYESADMNLEYSKYQTTKFENKCKRLERQIQKNKEITEIKNATAN
jgi:hypothetical protein